MARKRKKGSGKKILAGLIALVVIGVIGYSVFVEPIIPTQVTSLFGGVTDVFPTTTNNEDFWSIPASFYFAITPKDGIHCWIASTITQGNIDNTREVLASNKGLGVQLFEITGGITTSAKEVKFVKYSPVMSCQDQSGQGRDIRLVGGTIRIESFVKDKTTGIEKRVDTKFATIPALNRNLNVATGGGNVQLPTLISQASTIESFISVPDTVASRFIGITFKTSSYAQLNVVGSFTPVADLTTAIGGTLKFINPDFGSSLPPTEKGTQVTMTSINPITHHYISDSGEVPAGITSSKSIVTLNDEMRVTFKGTQDNWTGAEGLPTITVKDPRGIIRGSGIPMTTINTLSGGLTEFSRINVPLPFQITDNNIDFVKGTWTAEMHQAGRTQIGVKTFALLDSRPEVIDPEPTCNTDEVLVEGKCVPIVEQCPAGTSGTFPDCSDGTTCEDRTEQGEAIAGMTNQEVIDTFNDLNAKRLAGTITGCETTTFQLISAEVTKRGLNTTTPPTPIGSIGTAFIRYSSSLTDPTGGGGGGGCPLSGQVPTTALPLINLQLLGLGTCDGLRFGSVELTPSLDFGDNVKNIQIDSSSITLQQDLFLAKNNPYPAKPVIECTTPTRSNIGTCSVQNHDFDNDGTGNIQIGSKEVTFVRNFVDKDTRGDYEIVEVLFRESALIDKIQRNGVALADGDEVSLLYVIWGTFSGTNSGEQFIASIPAMTFVQSFTFATGISGAECEAPSQRVVFDNDGTVTEVGGDSGQCIACPELEGLGLVDSCPFVPPEMCPAGTTGTFPDCQVIIICNLPNEIIDGVCRPPLDESCPNSGEVRDPVTNVCRAPKMCNVDPICTATEKFQVTALLDDCGGNILICVPKTPKPTIEPCPDPNTQFRDSLGKCVTIKPNDCNEGEQRNSLGICEKTGVLTCPAGFTGIVPNCVPDGTNPKPINFCAFGQEGFNLSQCISSLFSSGGTEGLMISGTTQTALLVVGMIAVLVIIIAVIVRKRRGGGFSP